MNREQTRSISRISCVDFVVICTLTFACSCGRQDLQGSPPQRELADRDIGLSELSSPDASNRDWGVEVDQAEAAPVLPKPVLPEKVEAKLAWSVLGVCLDTWRSVDELTGRNVFVHDDPNDSTKQLLTMTLNTGSGDHYPSPRALVTLDVETGRPYPCVDLPDSNAISSDTILFDPHRRVVFYAYNEDNYVQGELYPEEIAKLVNGSIGVHVTTGEVVLHHKELRRRRNDTPRAVALAFGRSQFVSTPGKDRLVSLDARTGDVLWRLDGDRPGLSGEPWFIMELMTPAPDKLFLLDRWRTLFELNDKGVPTLRYDSKGENSLRGPIFFGERVVIEESNVDQMVVKVLKDWGSAPLYEEKNCGHMFSMSEERLGCFERSDYNKKIRLVSFNLDGSSRHERTLSVPEGLNRTISHKVVPLSPRHLLVTMGGSDPKEEGLRSVYLRDLYIVDMEDRTSVPTHLKIVPPNNFGTVHEITPLFTKSGVIIISIHGVFYGIQTNIPWTNRGSAPRGPLLGGNQNSGHALGPTR